MPNLIRFSRRLLRVSHAENVGQVTPGLDGPARLRTAHASLRIPAYRGVSFDCRTTVAAFPLRANAPGVRGTGSVSTAAADTDLQSSSAVGRE